MTAPPQLLIVLLIVVILFGGAKLPQLARSIGQAQKEFQTGLREGSKEEDGESTGTKES